MVSGGARRGIKVQYALAGAVALAGLAGAFTAPTFADIFRWDNGALIPGTAGITPAPNVNLSSLNLEYASLSSANLASASLQSSDLSFAFFEFAKLTSANFTAANLTAAYMPDTNATAAGRARFSGGG